MGDVANKDESDKCLDIAKAALQAGNLDKAARFADKALKLYPSDQVRTRLTILPCIGTYLRFASKAISCI